MSKLTPKSQQFLNSIIAAMLTDDLEADIHSQQEDEQFTESSMPLLEMIQDIIKSSSGKTIRRSMPLPREEFMSLYGHNSERTDPHTTVPDDYYQDMSEEYATSRKSPTSLFDLLFGDDCYQNRKAALAARCGIDDTPPSASASDTSARRGGSKYPSFLRCENGGIADLRKIQSNDKPASAKRNQTPVTNGNKLLTIIGSIHETHDLINHMNSNVNMLQNQVTTLTEAVNGLTALLQDKVTTGTNTIYSKQSVDSSAISSEEVTSGPIDKGGDILTRLNHKIALDEKLTEDTLNAPSRDFFNKWTRGAGESEVRRTTTPATDAVHMPDPWAPNRQMVMSRRNDVEVVPFEPNSTIEARDKILQFRKHTPHKKLHKSLVNLMRTMAQLSHNEITTTIVLSDDEYKSLTRRTGTHMYEDTASRILVMNTSEYTAVLIYTNETYEVTNVFTVEEASDSVAYRVMRQVPVTPSLLTELEAGFATSKK